MNHRFLKRPAAPRLGTFGGMKLLCLFGVLALATGTHRSAAQRVPAPGPGRISANLVLAPSDSAVYFAYARGGATGLYAVNRYTGAVRQLVRPVPGVVRSLALRGRTLLAVRTRPTPAGDRQEVATHMLGDSTWAPLAGAPGLLLDAAQAPGSGRLLLLLAADYGHSSPLARDRARLADVYSLAASDSAARRETALGAYALQGPLYPDPSGEHVYLNAQFLNGHDRDGPYRVALPGGGLESLLPRNWTQLQPAVVANAAARSFLRAWLRPTPSPYDAGAYFLHDLYNLYRVDGRTGAGTAWAFRRLPEPIGGVLRIQSVAAMHHTDGAALLLHFADRGRQVIRFVCAAGEPVDWVVAIPSPGTP